jgi:transcriptional regulator with XRE-family HTH domain
LWLKVERESHGITQAQMALQCGICQQEYSFIEQGKRTPRPPVAKKIDSILGFDWTLFFEDSENAS